MLVWNALKGRYVIDPHYLAIIPFKRVYEYDKDKEISEAKLLWIYHMYNPHSAFFNYKNSTKSQSIVDALFPKKYIEQKTKELTLSVKTEDTAPDAKSRYYDPVFEPFMEEAVKWYCSHLKQTPLWFAVESYKEAIYNTSEILRRSGATAPELKSASATLEDLPKQMDKMRQQAEKDEAITLRIQGDKNVKRGEMLHQDKKRASAQQ